MTKDEILKKIEQAVVTCKKCRLYRTANHAVPGEGSLNAKIVFVGEAPGYNEDVQGRPFVGRAGNLLDTLLRNIGLKRQDVWIGNIIKHRPPDNRDPMVDELRACRPFLADQVRAINPKVIVTLGRFAMAEYLPEAKISEVHGQAFRVGEHVVIPLYHPAAALRSESVLRDLKEDFRKIVRVYKTKSEEIPRYKESEAPAGESQMLLFNL
ncbi:MAG: uracil-DNA glycosylase [Patescibacteria group bacterium]|nr:uracil-DNA glycosylase [Patescibacteria group bacterium]